MGFKINSFVKVVETSHFDWLVNLALMEARKSIDPNEKIVLMQNLTKNVFFIENG